MSERFETLVIAHQDRLFSYATRLLSSPGEAQEVVQEVLLKFWDHHAELGDEAALPWMLRVTRNACLDVLRKRTRERNYAMAAGADWKEAELTPRTDEIVEQTDFRVELDKAVAELKEPYRSLIILREMQGHSYRDICSILDLPMPQVKSYLHRARKRLRHRLKEFEPDE